MEDTGISWTDHTHNPWHGCTKVSPGCEHCYAETQDVRYTSNSHWGKGVPRRTFGDKHWNEPLKWNKAAGKAGVPAKVFCGSMCDVMDNEAPDGQWSRQLELIDKTPNLVWQLLTKRPHYYLRNLPENDFAHDNVWLGASAENQEFYDVRWPRLQEAAAELVSRNNAHREGIAREVITFISYEPALGPITLRDFKYKPHWLIFGGESGSIRRPMEQAWAENIKAECEEFGVLFFMKQMSAFSPKQAADLIPAHLLVRNSPEVTL